MKKNNDSNKERILLYISIHKIFSQLPKEKREKYKGKIDEMNEYIKFTENAQKIA
jgi:hypothetical protein